MRDVGRRISELRESRGWTQEHLAERAGFSAKYVQHVEGGSANLTIRSLVRLANLLRVPVSDLFEPPRSQRRRPGRPKSR